MLKTTSLSFLRINVATGKRPGLCFYRTLYHFGQISPTLWAQEMSLHLQNSEINHISESCDCYMSTCVEMPGPGEKQALNNWWGPCWRWAVVVGWDHKVQLSDDCCSSFFPLSPFLSHCLLTLLPLFLHLKNPPMKLVSLYKNSCPEMCVKEVEGQQAGVGQPQKHLNS